MCRFVSKDKLWRLLVSSAVSPALGSEERTNEGELVNLESRQLDCMYVIESRSYCIAIWSVWKLIWMLELQTISVETRKSIVVAIESLESIFQIMVWLCRNVVQILLARNSDDVGSPRRQCVDAKLYLCTIQQSHSGFLVWLRVWLFPKLRSKRLKKWMEGKEGEREGKIRSWLKGD